jgi:hypothetical protein
VASLIAGPMGAGWPKGSASGPTDWEERWAAEETLAEPTVGPNGPLRR